MQITLNIPDPLIQGHSLNSADWMREIAIALFQQELITLGTASKITGLLRILVSAKQENLINELKPIVDQLIRQAKFRVHPDLYRQILQDVNESIKDS